MNGTDDLAAARADSSLNHRLELIRALRDNEDVVRLRSRRLAWTSVVLAAVVLVGMIGVGRLELERLGERTTVARAKLAAKQTEFAEAEGRLVKLNEQLTIARAELQELQTTLVTVRAETDDALRKLQSVKAGPRNRQLVDSAVDNLLAASVAAAPRQEKGGTTGSDSRVDAIRQLFDPTAAVRVRAYGALLPRYANDPTLVPEVLAVAREHPDDDNGIFNALVVLSHMNAASLTPHRAEIVAFAEQARRVGPRVAERARKLIRRIPP